MKFECSELTLENVIKTIKEYTIPRLLQIKLYDGVINDINYYKQLSDWLEELKDRRKGVKVDRSCDDFHCDFAASLICVAESCSTCEIHSCRGCCHLKDCIEENNLHFNI